MLKPIPRRLFALISNLFEVVVLTFLLVRLGPVQAAVATAHLIARVGAIS